MEGEVEGREREGPKLLLNQGLATPLEIFNVNLKFDRYSFPHIANRISNHQILLMLFILSTYM